MRRAAVDLVSNQPGLAPPKRRRNPRLSSLLKQLPPHLEKRKLDRSLRPRRLHSHRRPLPPPRSKSQAKEWLETLLSRQKKQSKRKISRLLRPKKSKSLRQTRNSQSSLVPRLSTRGPLQKLSKKGNLPLKSSSRDSLQQALSKLKRQPHSLQKRGSKRKQPQSRSRCPSWLQRP